MMKHLGVVAAAVTALAAGAAQASDLVDGKKGISISAPIAGGNANAAFGYGVGNLVIEGGLGFSVTSPDKGDSFTNFDLGLGAHFFALRAEKAALSAGGRFNFGLTTVQDKPDSSGNPQTKNATSIAFDLPIRLYWFADEHFSFHFESGVRFALASDDGNVFAGKQPTPQPEVSAEAIAAAGTDSAPVAGGLPKKTSQFGAFDQFAGIGATFWW